MHSTDKPGSTTSWTAVDRLAWLERIATDPELPPAASRVAIVISRYVNSTTSEAWPSQARLCDDLQSSEDTLRRCVAALAERGHLTVVPGGGRGRSTTYRPVLETPATLQGFDQEKGCKDARVSDENPRRSAAKPQQDCDPNYKKNYTIGREISVRSENLDQTRRPEAGGQPDRDHWFEQFWAEYPRAEGRARALRAWQDLIRAGGDPEAIIAGARRYARFRATEPDPGDRHRFTAMPARWLSEERWRDAATPATGGVLLDEAGEVLTERLAQRSAKPSPSAQHAALADFTAQYAAQLERAEQEDCE